MSGAGVEALDDESVLGAAVLETDPVSGELVLLELLPAVVDDVLPPVAPLLDAQPATIALTATAAPRATMSFRIAFSFVMGG